MMDSDLRDFFAASALTGLLASGEPDLYENDGPPDGFGIVNRKLIKTAQERAFDYADAMMAERAKR